VTPSERRLHPVSILFSLGGSLKALALPALFIFFGARSSGPSMGPWNFIDAVPGSFETWALWLVIPATAVSVVRYLTFRMRFDGTELVIRSGLLFRNERHIPYARIQNLNSIRNVLHRMLGMTDVQIETASGQAAEATISVVPLAVLDEMRERVFAGRTPASASPEDAAGASGPAPQELLRLPFSELALLSVIQNRGLLPIAAGFGLLWEFGLVDRVSDLLGGNDLFGGGAVRGAVEGVAAGQIVLWQIGAAILTILGALALVQLLSLLWVVMRLHDFRLTRVGEDLRTGYGLFTRVATTVPLRRIQSITVEQGPLQRLAGRVGVRVETAGGGGVPTSGMSVDFGEGSGGASRQWLAPTMPVGALPALLHAVLPDLDPDALAWQAPHPRALRRALKRTLFVATLLALLPIHVVAVGLGAGLWVYAALPLVLAWTAFVTRQNIRRLAWGLTEPIVGFRSGWIWQRTVLARTAKIQVVTRLESPFDRRAEMGRVRADTAGGGEWSARVDIPYLPRDVADGLYARLAARAASTDFRW
jgi:putative membrane protein